MIALRLFLTILVIAGAALGMAWFADNPGAIRVDWLGYRLETSVGVAALIVGVALISVMALFRIWRWLREGPGYLGGLWARGRRARALRALRRGLFAAAGGDAAEARRQGRRARMLGADSGMLDLLAAETQRLAGGAASAEKLLLPLCDNPESATYALRGLHESAVARKDEAAAFEMARRAQGLKRDLSWSLAALLDLYPAHGDYGEAEDALDDAVKSGLLERDEAKRRRAAIRLARAEVARRADVAAARELALEAAKLDPSLTPALALAARLFAESGKDARATSIVRKAWASSPHSDIAAALDSLDKGERPAEALKRVKKLVAVNRGHPESRLLLARYAIAAGEWGLAKSELATLLSDGATRRIATLAALLEEKAPDGDAAAAEEWRRRARLFGDGEGWRCDGCGHRAKAWFAVCPACRRFAGARAVEEETRPADDLAPPLTRPKPVARAARRSSFLGERDSPSRAKSLRQGALPPPAPKPSSARSGVVDPDALAEDGDEAEEDAADETPPVKH